jgi:hypothetical protein
MPDLGHLAGRIPDGHGDPAVLGRRHQARVAADRHELAARGVLDAADEGAALRHVNTLRHDPAVDPWRVLEVVGVKVLSRTASAT